MKYIKALSIFGLLSIFAGCTNFLNSAELKEKLETQIEVDTSENDTEKPVLGKMLFSNIREGVLAKTSNTYVTGTFEEVLSAVGEEKFFAVPYHTNSLWIYLECSDDAGIDYIKCKEITLFNVKGDDLKEKAAAKPAEIKLCQNTFAKGSGSRFSLFEYTFDSNTVDGIVELTFTAVDYAGRESEESFTCALVKDTSVSDYAGVYPSIDTDCYVKGRDAGDINDLDDYYESCRRVYVNELSRDLFATWNGKEYCSGYDDFSVDIYTGDSLDNLKLFVKNSELKKFLDDPADSSTRYADKYFDMDSSKEYFIKTVTKDLIGNTAESIRRYCPIPKLICSVDEGDKYSLIFERDVFEEGSFGSSSSDCKYVYWNEGDNKAMDNCLCDDNEDEMAVYYTDKSKKYTIYIKSDDTGVLSEKYSVTPALTDSGVDSNILAACSYEFKKASEIDACVRVPFELDLEKIASNGYEKLFVVGEYSYSSYKYEVRKIIFDKNNPQNKAQMLLPADKSYDYTVTVYAVKGGNLYNSGKQTASFTEDCAKPVIKITDSNYQTGKYILTLYDKPSGTLDGLVDDEGYYYVTATWKDDGGQKSKIIKANASKVTFSFDNLELYYKDDGYPVNPCTITFKVTDRAGYSVEEKRTFDKYDVSYQYSIKKNGTYAVAITQTSKNNLDIGSPYVDYFNTSTKKWSGEVNQPVRVYGSVQSSFYSLYNKDFVRLTSLHDGSYMEPQYFYIDSDCDKYYSPFGYISYQSQSDAAQKKIGVTVNSPVYIHTIFADIDRGDLVRNWERWCPDENKVNRKTFVTNFSKSDISESVNAAGKIYVYDIDESDIPSGKYYRVAVHFADGSSAISKCYKKD